MRGKLTAAWNLFIAVVSTWQGVLAILAIVAFGALIEGPKDLGFTGGVLCMVLPFLLGEDKGCPKVVFWGGQLFATAFLVYMIAQTATERVFVGTAIYAVFMLISTIFFWEFWKKMRGKPASSGLSS